MLGRECRLAVLFLVIGPISAASAQEEWLTHRLLAGHSIGGGQSISAGWQDPLVESAIATDAHSGGNLFDDLSPAVASELAGESSQSILLVQGSSGGAGGGGGGGDLAAKSQNPISDLVSLPLQNNWDFGIGPGDDQRYIGNLQPVVPVKLNDNWNLINRVIVPFVNSPVGPGVDEHGIGNIVGQFFFSPRDAESFIWGVGPAVLFPTSSDPAFGPQEWGAGVDAVALVSKGPIVTGALVSQIWSVEGSTQPFLVQPFFNYNLPKGWFLNASGECNADWALPQDSRWSFPLGGGVGRVFPILGQPVNILVRFAPYVLKPDGGPDWQFRLQVNLLFPK